MTEVTQSNDIDTSVQSVVSGWLSVGPTAADPADEVSEALLAAGREMIQSFGIRRLRMDDVARAAGYGRATLYRRFATRDDLVWAVVTREIHTTLLEISVQIRSISDLRERIVEAFAVTLERVRANPLLQRLLHIEADLLLPHLTTRGDEWLTLGRNLIIEMLKEGRSRGELRPIDIEVTAELMVRVAHSMTLTPRGLVAIDDPRALRTFARTFIADPVFRPPNPQI
ncbi:MAG: TetR/AcrR family transcriptional regulator [Euzebya sp.]